MNDIGSIMGPVVLSSIADYSNLSTPFYVMAGYLTVNALFLGIFTKEIIDTKKINLMPRRS